MFRRLFSNLAIRLAGGTRRTAQAARRATATVEAHLGQREPGTLATEGPSNKPGTVFFCRRCGARLTRPLQQLQNFQRLNVNPPDYDYHNPPKLLPKGFYVTSDAVIAAGIELVDQGGWFPGELLFHNDDIQRHPELYNSEDFGCCGYSGAGGPNVYCPGGHTIGTEISDCIFIHYLSIPRENLVEEQVGAA